MGKNHFRYYIWHGFVIVIVIIILCHFHLFWRLFYSNLLHSMYLLYWVLNVLSIWCLEDVGDRHESGLWWLAWRPKVDPYKGLFLACFTTVGTKMILSSFARLSLLLGAPMRRLDKSWAALVYCHFSTVVFAPRCVHLFMFSLHIIFCSVCCFEYFSMSLCKYSVGSFSKHVYCKVKRVTK